ncbi:cache domain-containing sensor histidine kinase [Marinicrinis sediminis]|uniref:Sensor histidine kinase n=1 Tax=Marinicrinis sediminis TaxID=1652465 RepID=A0ABW5RGA2_9BACL
MRPFKKWKLQRVMFTIFAGFILILLVCIIWASYQISSSQMLKNTSYYQQSLLRELNREVSVLLHSVEQSSLAAARNLKLDDYYQEQDGVYDRYTRLRTMQDMMAQTVYSSTILEFVELYIDDHILTQKHEAGVRVMDMDKVEDQSFYSLLEDTDAAWMGNHIIDTYRGERSVITFARKLYAFNGEFHGILVFHVKESVLSDMLDEVTEENAIGSNRMLFDAGNRLIFSTDEEPLSFADEHVMWQEEWGKSSGYERTVIEQASSTDEQLMVWNRAPRTGWVMVELTPWKEMTKGSVELAVKLAWIGAAAVVVALLFTLWVTRQFTRPIRLLTSAMNKFSVTRKSVYLPEDYTNEFGVMFNGYDKLTHRTLELYQSLEQQYKKQREAEITALQANINPHFLYNTLDQINWMAIGAGQSQISRVLELVGRMFRIQLSDGKTLITLREEIEHVACYMEIQQLQFGEGLQFQVEVEQEELLECYLPKLTIQPFIENSIKHGFHGRTEGRVRLHIQPNGRDVQLTIYDNGSGFDDTQPQAKPAAGPMKIRTKGGYGIRNVRERIQALFGDRYDIQVSSVRGEGTTVTLNIPRMDEQQAV